MNVWAALEQGIKHLEMVCHRRWGKDEICLHWAAVSAFSRVGDYWHCLPEQAQARKAIWDATNPLTGRRRIDDAFPEAIRANTRDQDMFIRFINGSTWRVVGSDNYNSLVGTPPIGITYSEWALANPAVRGYLRPILRENKGWELFIGTPRGRNHAYTSYINARNDPEAYAELMTVRDSGAMNEQEIIQERNRYVADYGLDQGMAMFNQEYLCDFAAAIMGSIWGGEIQKLEDIGRLHVQDLADDQLHTTVVMDLGHRDNTALWFYQCVSKELRIVHFYQNSFKPLDHYISYIKDQKFRYHKKPVVWLPHDGFAKTLQTGRSMEEVMLDGGLDVRRVPDLSLDDGINVARRLLMSGQVHFSHACDEGVEYLRGYHRRFDEKLRAFTKEPVHDFTADAADAFRYLSIVWEKELQPVIIPKSGPTINDLIAKATRLRLEK